MRRFLDFEKWRKDFEGGVDKLVQNFSYEEKPKVFEYYPQYYHKTDKVSSNLRVYPRKPNGSRGYRPALTLLSTQLGWATRVH